MRHDPKCSKGSAIVGAQGVCYYDRVMMSTATKRMSLMGSKGITTTTTTIICASGAWSEAE